MPSPAPQHDQLHAAAATRPDFQPGDLAWQVNPLHRHAWTPVVIASTDRLDYICRFLSDTGELRRGPAFLGCLAPLSAAPEGSWTPEQRAAVTALRGALTREALTRRAEQLRAEADADERQAEQAEQEAATVLNTPGGALTTLIQEDLRIYALTDLAHHLRGAAHARRELAFTLDGQQRPAPRADA